MTRYNLKEILKANKRIKEFMFISFVIACCLVAISLTTPLMDSSNPFFLFPGDHHEYISMAEFPFGPVPAPFAYRILTPLLAWMIPFDTMISFQIISLTSLFLTGIFLYSLYTKLAGRVLALTGIVLFYSLEFGARFLVFDFWLVDSLAFLFITASIWAIHARNYRLYSILLIIGVLCKETVLFTVPVFIIFYMAQQKLSKNTIRNLVVHITPAVVVFLILRLFIVVNQSQVYDPLALLFEFGYQRLVTLPQSIYRYTIASWGLILFIFPLFNRREDITKWFKQYGIFLVLVYSQLLIAPNTERLIVVGFLPVILISILGMKKISSDTISVQIAFLVVSIVYFGYRLLTNAPFDSTDPFILHVLFAPFALGFPLIVKIVESRFRQTISLSTDGELSSQA